MLKKILVVLVVLVAGLAAAIATRPATYKVERSALVAAPPAAVYAQISDFHRWEAWSPWARLDPKMKVTYEGSGSGVGAVYGWAGNDQVGEGRMTITEALPPQHVAIKLEFLKPMASVADTRFHVAPEGPGSRVTWTMSGANDFMGKAWDLFVGLDKVVGRDFEKGLAQLKVAAEAAPAP